MTDEDTARVRAYESDKQAINELKRGTETQADVIRRLLNDDDTPPETQELVTVEDALAELRENGAGSDTEIDTDELAERVASRTADSVVSELKGMQ